MFILENFVLKRIHWMLIADGVCFLVVVLIRLTACIKILQEKGDINFFNVDL